MDIDFQGKRALVTGAGNGIGRATALKLLHCNARIIALDIDASALDDLKSQYPEIETAVANVSHWEGVKKVIEGLGPIDLLVNNAAIMAFERIGDVTEESLSRVLDINVKSLINISQVVSNGIKQRGASGAIVNLASVSSKLPAPGLIAYSVSKAAVLMITQALAVELGPHKIRVNTVCPTLISTTSMGKTVTGYLVDDQSTAATFTQRHSLKTLVGPENIAEAIAFLLSDRSSTIHGVHLPVDAGVLAT